MTHIKYTIKNILKTNPALKLLIFIVLGLVTQFTIRKILIVNNINSIQDKLEFLNSGVNTFINLFFLSFFIFALIKNYKSIAYLFITFLIGFNLNYLYPTQNEIKQYLFEPREVLILGKVDKILGQSENYTSIIVDGEIKSSWLPNHNSKIFLKVRQISKKNENLESNEQNENHNLFSNLQLGSYISCKTKIRTPQKMVILNEFDEITFAQTNQIQWIGSGFKNDFAIISRNDNNTNLFFNAVYRQINILYSKYQNQSQSFVTAFILGDKTKLDYEIKEIFSKNGTAHLFAISGLHIGIFTLIIFLLTNFISNRTIKYLLISTVLISYSYFINMPSSTIRAVSLVILYFYAKSLDLKLNPLNLFCFFIVILLLFFNDLLDNMGLQLSLAAFGGIVTLYKPINNRLSIGSKSTILTYLINSISITLAVSVFISPLTAYYFNFFTITTIISNLFTVSILSLAIFYSFLSVILSFISLDLGSLFTPLVSSLIDMSIWFNRNIYINDVFMIDGQSSLFYSIIFGLVILILISTKSLKLFFIRLSYVLIIIVIFYNFESFIIKHIYKSNYHIHPNSKLYYRQQNNLIHLVNKENTNKEFNIFILEQRKFYSYYQRDNVILDILLEKIKSKNAKNILIYNGDVGYEIIKDVNFQLNSQSLNKNLTNNLKVLRLKLSDIEEINKSLNLNRYFYNNVK